jgi:hypothetical protein
MASGPLAFLAETRRAAITLAPVDFGEATVQTDFDIDAPEPGELPDRTGYVWGVPRGGTKTSTQRSSQKNRRELLEDLWLVYESCIWVSANVDRIAAAVTAGGIALRSNNDITGNASLTPSPEVVALIHLFRFCNTDQNINQVLREFCTDLLIFSDAYLEVQWVSGYPAALYNLDAASMSIDADEHGKVQSYIQELDSQRKATFKPHEVIHVKLGGRGLYGLGPTRKALGAAKTWIWAQAALNERMRQGDPERLHVDLPEDMAQASMKRWFRRFMMTNRGTKSVGTPIITKGGGKVTALGQQSVENLIKTKTLMRDEMVSEYGTPPNKVSIIESGNLGGGTGESQDKTWKYDITMPLQDLLAEAIQYAIVQQGYGITDQHIEFPQVDMRDSKTIEDIRDQKLRNGSFTLNQYLQDCGEKPIGPAGDVRVIIDRGNIVMWPDIPAYTMAEILKDAPNVKVERDKDGVLQIEQIEPIAPTTSIVPFDAPGAEEPAAPVANPDLPAKREPDGTESAADREHRQLTESFDRAFRHRRKRALRELPQVAAADE